MMSNIQALAGALALSAALVSPAAPASDRKEKTVFEKKQDGLVLRLVWTGDGWKNEITPPKKEAPEKKP
ncbi:MAG: hypothetical protein NTW03_02880, partial [Verrucomicrobia bacterium]|nr:hypothetical protein [Verrucomicrobiota bacterium]